MNKDILKLAEIYNSINIKSSIRSEEDKRKIESYLDDISIDEKNLKLVYNLLSEEAKAATLAGPKALQNWYRKRKNLLKDILKNILNETISDEVYDSVIDDIFKSLKEYTQTIKIMKSGTFEDLNIDTQFSPENASIDSLNDMPNKLQTDFNVYKKHNEELEDIWRSNKSLYTGALVTGLFFSVMSYLTTEKREERRKNAIKWFLLGMSLGVGIDIVIKTIKYDLISNQFSKA